MRGLELERGQIADQRAVLVGQRNRSDGVELAGGGGEVDPAVVVVVDRFGDIAVADLLEEVAVVDRLPVVAGEQHADREDREDRTQQDPHRVARPSAVVGARPASRLLTVARRWRRGRGRIGRHG